jgi:hypothetical protein
MPPSVVILLAITAALDTVPVVAIEPAESAQVHVTYDAGSHSYDLRFYGSNEFTVASWWIGISDSVGHLLGTAVCSDPGRTGAEVLQWLRPIVGVGIAERLVQLARDATRTVTTY